MKQVGIVAAFKQVSGVITSHSNFYALARFSINENYGDAARFKLVSQALPFIIKNLKPQSPVLEQNPPLITFTVVNPNMLMTSISCYQSDLGKLKIYHHNNNIVITPKQPFTLRRTHINCTVADKNKRWHWLGLMYIVNAAQEG